MTKTPNPKTLEVNKFAQPSPLARLLLRRQPGILESKYHTRVESSANGMTNCAAVVAVVMATSFLGVTVWSKRVAKSIHQLLKSRTGANTKKILQAYYYKSDGPLLPAPWGILLMHCMWNTICSSWVFSNVEAHRSF